MFEVDEYRVDKMKVDKVEKGEELTKVIATDLDDPATDDNGLVTYSLGSSQEHFEIDPQTGLVTAKVTLGRGIWRADVIAEDGGGLTGAATLVVKVGEVV